MIVISNQPRKLSIIAERGGIPIDLFLGYSNHNDVLENYIAVRCQDIMFEKPANYLAKVERVLSIEIGACNSKTMLK